MARVRSLCEQEYHGVVRCALGWACWKTYLGRSERTKESVPGDDAAWRERFIREADGYDEAALSV